MKGHLFNILLSLLPLLILPAMLLLPAALSAAPPAEQNGLKEKREQVQALEEEIALINKQIASFSKKEKNTLNSLALIRRKVEARKSLISKLESELAAQNRELKSHQQRLKRLESTLDTLSANYRHLIYTAYKNRDTRKWFLYLFASRSIEQGYRRWIYLKDYCQAINAQAEKILKMREETELARKRVLGLRASTEEKQNARRRELEQFRKDERAGAATAAQLAKEQKRLRQDLKKKQTEAANLNRQIEKMLSAALKQSGNSKDSALKEEEIKLSGEFGANKGRLPWPLERYVVVESFGQHPHPVLKNVMLPFNNGVNLSSTAKAAVKSVFGGTVKQIIIIPGYSHCVLVQHGTYFTFYCKLGRVKVKVGQKLSTGEVIGTLEEKILHFELWQGTTKQNPQLWLRK